MKELIDNEDQAGCSPLRNAQEVVRTSRKVLVGGKVWYVSSDSEKYMTPEFTQRLTEHMHRAKKKALEQTAE